MEPDDLSYFRGYRAADGPFVVKFQPLLPPLEDMMVLDAGLYEWGPGNVSDGRMRLAELLLTAAHGRAPRPAARERFADLVIAELSRYGWLLTLEDIRELEAGPLARYVPKAMCVQGIRSSSGTTTVRVTVEEPEPDIFELDDVEYDWGRSPLNQGHLNLAHVLLFIAYRRNPELRDQEECAKWFVTSLPEEGWILTREEIGAWYEKVPGDAF